MSPTRTESKDICVSPKRSEEASCRMSEMGALSSLLKRFDTNHSGKLELDQLANLLRDFNGVDPTEEELNFIVKLCDTKKCNNGIDLCELKHAVTAWKEYCSKREDMQAAMRKFNKSQTGRLNREELKDYLSELNDGLPVSDQEVDWVLEKADVFGDGHCNTPELAKATSAWYVLVEAKSRDAAYDVPLDDGTILQQMRAILKHSAFEYFMGLAIVFNVGIIVVETDMQTTCSRTESDDHCESNFTFYCNLGLLALYTAELLMRILVKRRKVLKSSWFYIDLVIIGTGIVEFFVESVPNLQMFRLFRILRLTRVVKMLRHFPTLYFLLRGFAGAMEAIMWGVSLILILLLLWAIIAVELLHEINITVDHGPNAEWCGEITDSVLRVVLYFFQTLVAGDSWGMCAIPIIKAQPLSYLIFAGSLVTVQLGFTNLILAIIVDKAVMAREADNEELIKVKQQQKLRFAQHLKEVLQQADHDNSGTLSLDEMKQAYDEDDFVRKSMNMMDVDRKDLATLFQFMGAGTDGEVGWEEFVEIFQKSQTQDMRVYLMVMKLQIEQLYKMLHEAHYGGPSINRQNGKVSVAGLSTSSCSRPASEFGQEADLDRKSKASWAHSEASQDSFATSFKQGVFSELPSQSSARKESPNMPLFLPLTNMLQSSTVTSGVLDEELDKLRKGLESKFKDLTTEVMKSVSDLARVPDSAHPKSGRSAASPSPPPIRSEPTAGPSPRWDGAEAFSNWSRNEGRPQACLQRVRKPQCFLDGQMHEGPSIQEEDVEMSKKSSCVTPARDQGRRPPGV